MKRTTQKALKELARLGYAEDITHRSFEDLRELPYMRTVALSIGVYGMNGAELEDQDGKKYVITARNSALFQMV